MTDWTIEELAGAIRQGETELHRISAWVLAQWPKDYSF